MKAIWLAGLIALVPLQHAHGWGQERHSIVAEIAQRRLDQDTLKKIKSLLGGEISLGSGRQRAKSRQPRRRSAGGPPLVPQA